MKILALDTATSNCSAAIIDENSIIANFNLNTGLTHSQTLVPMVDIMCKYADIDLNDIEVFACSVGPGSFTGLRIGIATIKGFALSLNKKVIGVPSLVGLAYNIPYFDGIICSVLDARNDNVYAGLFKYEDKPKMIENYFTDSVDALIENLKVKNEKVIFVGDGAVAFKEKFKEALGEKAFFAPLHLNESLATSIAKAALDKATFEEFDTCDTVMPLYLKKSQAEREAENKLQNNS